MELMWTRWVRADLVALLRLSLALLGLVAGTVLVQVLVRRWLGQGRGR